MSLHLFLAHADTHAPVVADGLPSVSSRAVAESMPKPDGTTPGHLADRGGLADALPDQRWGLVVPKGEEGKKLLELVEPLRRKRAEDQGAEVVVYEVDPDMGPEDANLWISRDYRDGVNRNEADLPRYLLLLGGPDKISWDFQQMLGSEGFVGRLAFTDERGAIDASAFEAYVDKVLRWERVDPVEETRAILYTTQDGSQAIREGYEYLMKPSAEALRKLQKTGNLLTSDVLEIGGTKQCFSIDDLLDGAHEFLTQAERTQAGLLFSMNHGLGLPAAGRWSSIEEQHRLQGAMAISPQNDRITATEIGKKQKFLSGGLWLMFACFSAGTPSRSSYAAWLEQLEALGHDHSRRAILSALPRAGEPPFIAALPQKALAHPEGPLGVIGHVDLAWTWSFLEDVATDNDTSARARHERFQGILRSALKGRRFGVAHGELTHFFGEVNRALVTTYDESTTRRTAEDDRTRKTRRADLWMQRQDLAGHVFLGDPAARLALTPAPPGIPGRDSDPDSGSLLGFAASKPRAVKPSQGLDLRDMEAAVLAYLRDAGAVDVIAKSHGISPATLLGFVETYQEWGRKGLMQRKK